MAGFQGRSYVSEVAMDLRHGPEVAMDLRHLVQGLGDFGMAITVKMRIKAPLNAGTGTRKTCFKPRQSSKFQGRSYFFVFLTDV